MYFLLFYGTEPKHAPNSGLKQWSTQMGRRVQPHSSTTTKLTSNMFNKFEMRPLSLIRESTSLSMVKWQKHSRFQLKAYLKAIHIHGWRCAQKVVFTYCVDVPVLTATSLLTIAQQKQNDTQEFVFVLLNKQIPFTVATI